MEIHFSERKKHDSVLKSENHPVCNPWTIYGDSPGQNTGVGSLSLLQGIFPTQGLNPGLPYCRRILYPLSHKRSPFFEFWTFS